MRQGDSGAARALASCVAEGTHVISRSACRCCAGVWRLQPTTTAPVADILKPAPFSLDALAAEVRVAVSRARQADDAAKANAAHDGLGVEWTQDGKVAQAGLWEDGGLAN